jgi:hypothetical protein
MLERGIAARQGPRFDTKKKELIGNFKNGGTDYRPKGDPQRVNVHDFKDKKLGKVAPYRTGTGTCIARVEKADHRGCALLCPRPERPCDRQCCCGCHGLP